ncbi:MAG: hypothetical protein K6E98_09575 [Lachnospiraceae bacterium]|nr:hypothetical protein [Lachnospiraceae bacterium]
MDVSMYVCERCGKVFIIHGHDRISRCTNCRDVYLKDMHVSLEDWKSFGKKTRAGWIRQFKPDYVYVDREQVQNEQQEQRQNDRNNYFYNTENSIENNTENNTENHTENNTDKKDVIKSVAKKMGFGIREKTLISKVINESNIKEEDYPEVENPREDFNKLKAAALDSFGFVEETAEEALENISEEAEETADAVSVNAEEPVQEEILESVPESAREPVMDSLGFEEEDESDLIEFGFDLKNGNKGFSGYGGNGNKDSEFDFDLEEENVFDLEEENEFDPEVENEFDPGEEDGFFDDENKNQISSGGEQTTILPGDGEKLEEHNEANDLFYFGTADNDEKRDDQAGEYDETYEEDFDEIIAEEDYEKVSKEKLEEEYEEVLEDSPEEEYEEVFAEDGQEEYEEVLEEISEEEYEEVFAEDGQEEYEEVIEGIPEEEYEEVFAEDGQEEYEEVIEDSPEKAYEEVFAEDGQEEHEEASQEDDEEYEEAFLEDYEEEITEADEINRLYRDEEKKRKDGIYEINEQDVLLEKLKGKQNAPVNDLGIDKKPTIVPVENNGLNIQVDKEAAIAVEADSENKAIPSEEEEEAAGIVLNEGDPANEIAEKQVKIKKTEEIEKPEKTISDDETTGKTEEVIKEYYYEKGTGSLVLKRLFSIIGMVTGLVTSILGLNMLRRTEDSMFLVSLLAICFGLAILSYFGHKFAETVD